MLARRRAPLLGGAAETLHKAALFIAAHPDFGSAPLSHCGNLEEAQAMATDNYCGVYQSLADYAEELTEETTQIPATLRNCIDYNAMARDMEMNGDVVTIETGCRELHIFWSR